MVAALLIGPALSSSAQGQTVTKVDSGDTIVVEGVGKVRLLGIRHTDPSAFRLGGNTAPFARTGPETRPPNAFGGAIAFKRERPARDLLRQLVLGKTVRVQYDRLVGDKPDARAYVFVGDMLVNAEIIRQGRARVDDTRPFEHLQEFHRLERQARDSGVGIWTSVR